MSRHLACLLLSLGVVAPAWAHAASPLYVMSIGSNEAPRQTSQTLQTLNYADDDAVRFYKALGSLAAKRALLTLPDLTTQRLHPGIPSEAKLPTLANIDATLKGFTASMKRDIARGDRPTLIVTYSGHGTRTRQGTSYLHLRGEERLTRALLARHILEATPATRVHLIVDSCQAGDVMGARGEDFFASEASASAAPTPTTLAAEPLQQRYPHLGVLLASTRGSSHEWSAISSGIFSHEVLSALQGAADINGDGRIAYSEVAAFVSAAHIKVPNPRVVPRVVARPPRTDRGAVLLELGSVRPALLSRRFQGRLRIESVRGVRYLDAHLSGGPLRVILPAGESLVVQTSKGTASVGALLQDRDQRLDALTFQATPKGRGSMLDAGWFARPFGRGYYEGFVANQGLLPVVFGEDLLSRQLEQESAQSCCRALATGLLITSGVSLGVAAIGGVNMWQSAQAYNETKLQVPAREARDLHLASRNVVLGAGGVALLMGAVSWWLWPRDEAELGWNVGVSDRGLVWGGVW